jgi:hypothetical protein
MFDVTLGLQLLREADKAVEPAAFAGFSETKRVGALALDQIDVSSMMLNSN